MIEQDMALTNEKPLQSWKEIAAYLERDERTARRWEKEEGLPVRRHRQDGRGTVYAYASELDAWRLERKPRAAETDGAEAGARWPKWLAPAAAGLALVGALLAVRYGPILNPPRPLVKAAGEVVTARVVWSGAGVDARAAVTPDGGHVAATGPGGELVLRELRTGAVRRLVAAGEAGRTRAFSHDGRWLAYEAGGEGARSLRLLRVSDGTPRTIWEQAGTRGVEVWGWSPDDREVLVTLETASGRALALVGVEGGVRRLAVGVAGPGAAAMSPDGQWVAFDHPQAGTAARRDISVVSVDGTSEYVLAREDGHEALLGWGRSGVLFTRGRSGGTDLYLQPVHAGRGAGEAVVLKRDVGEAVAGQFDGRGVFYYGVGGGEPRLWSLEWTGEGGGRP